ncbi:MAG TPA: FG-GAP-like repeat-containing protein, partial [Rhodothermales bacterium]
MSDAEWIRVQARDDTRFLAGGTLSRSSIHLCVTAFLLLTIGTARSTEAQPGWFTADGSFAGNVTEFAFSPTGTAYAVSDSGFVYRSTDRGETWEDATANLPIDGLAVEGLSVNDAGTVFIGKSAGRVYRMTHGGNSWQLTGNTTSTRDVTALVTIGVDTVFAGFRGDGVLKSTNGGNTWQSANSGGFPPGIPNVLDLGVDSDGTVYACVAGAGLYMSTDRGANWTAIDDELPDGFDVEFVAVNPYLRQLVVRTGDGLLSSSTDRGAKWRGIHADTFSDVAFTGPGRLWLSSFASGIFRSTDGGESWSDELGGFDDPAIHTIAADAGGRVLAGGFGFVVFTDDEEAVPDFPAPSEVAVSQVLVDPSEALAGPYLRIDWKPPVIPDAPVLFSPSVAAAGDCAVANGLSGDLFTFSAGYSDPNGDFLDAVLDTLLAPPSPYGAIVEARGADVSTTGDGSSGQLEIPICVAFLDSPSASFDVAFQDGSCNSGNYLSLTVANPGAGKTLRSASGTVRSQSTACQGTGLRLVGYRVFRVDDPVETPIAIVPPNRTSHVDDYSDFPDQTWEDVQGSRFRYTVSAIYETGESEPFVRPNGSIPSGDVPEGVDPASFERRVVGQLPEDTAPSQGAVWGDYDGDGDLDLFVATNGPVDRLYRNDGGDFTRIEGSGLTDAPTNAFGASWGDCDNDGKLDIAVPNAFGQSAVYVGDGSGRFDRRPVGPNGAFYTSATWVDYDSDQDLDLFFTQGLGQPNHLYRNTGTCEMEQIGASVAGDLVADSDASYSAVWSDLDRDGDDDVVVANVGPNRVYRNNGDGSFSEVAGSALSQDSDRSFGVSVADYDNDGGLDIFVANDLARNALYRSVDPPNFTFEKVVDPNNPVVTDDNPLRSEGSAWADFDSDGDLDLFVANDGFNFFYVNKGGGEFERLKNETSQSGAPGLAAIVTDAGPSSAAAFADIDGDLDLDLLVLNPGAGENNYLYVNTNKVDSPDGIVDNANRGALLRLQGGASNSSAIGARIVVKSTIGATVVEQRREISAQSGRGS